MGIFSQHKDQKQSKLALIFDIGSSSVGGMLCEMQQSGIPRIVFAIREPIILEKDINVDRFFSQTIQSLEIIVELIYRSGMGAPEMIFCVLSSPWHISQTRVIKLNKNAPFLVTTKLVDNLIKKEVSLFEAEYFAEYMQAGNAIRTIELKNIKMKLSGYETLNPLNQKTSELEITIFLSISPEQILGAMEDTIRQHFHANEIKFSSFVIASFAVMRDMYTNQNNFLLIDIGGEVTNISMTKQNILYESISFPWGLNFIIRGVASALNCSLAEAKTYVALFQAGHAADSVVKKLEPVINKLRTKWLTKFQESLANLSRDISVPAVIFLTTEQVLADFFRQTIETEQFNQYTLTESKFKVTFLSADVFHGMVEGDSHIVRDPGLVIDSIYINRFFN
ncbi:MAG: cell division protein FtsA [Candidatus Paceibacterota bacterium]